MYGEASAYGIHAKSTGTSGTKYGGYFESASTSGRAVAGDATASSGITYGGKFHSGSTGGRGCYGWATATMGTTYGGAFKSSSPDGYGVWGKAEATTGTNYGLYASTNSDDGYAGYFDGDVTIDGDLTVNGSSQGFFPRPAYDSGWVAISQGGIIDLWHNLGGDPDNYLVDLMKKDDDNPAYGRNNEGIGLYFIDLYGDDTRGAYWYGLNSSHVSVKRAAEDWSSDEIRIRIWVYE
jgi:hypothetical protein